MYAISFQFPGDEVAQVDRVLFGLEKIPDECLDPSVPDGAGSEIVDSFREIVEETIEDGGRNAPFKPLSPRYAARKPEGLPTLVLSGRMRKAFTQPGGLNVTKYSKGSRTLTLGVRENSSVGRRAIYHQGGTKNADGSERMPARPPVQLSETDKRTWIKFIQAMVRRRAGSLGS